MTRKNERPVALVVIATGISSVVTQLYTIREFLAQFQGNEFIIALILFIWLMMGGAGAASARLVTRRLHPATATGLCWLTLCLSVLAVLQLHAIRFFRDVVFIHGSSVGFYPILAYTFFTLLPYTVLLGFVLPFSLFVLRAEDQKYSGARIYMMDNLGDTLGGALFCAILVHLATPFQAVCLSHLPLIAAVHLLFPPGTKKRPPVLLGLGSTMAVLLLGMLLEPASLTPVEGKLVFYRESRYGRIEVRQDREQFTLFEDGAPVFSSQNLGAAEEAIHYPLAQLFQTGHVLLISAEGGMLEEVAKHHPRSVDYVEMDPEIASVQFRFGLLKPIPGLTVIHQDARAYLAKTTKAYDAIIVNLPEPSTFQVNRFFTDRFFELARDRLTTEGVLGFSMEGFDNYLAEPQRQKLSTAYNTAADYFSHIVLLPGERVFFVCRNTPVDADIPGLLDKKGVPTQYIQGFYHGDMTGERIARLNALLDPQAPKNRDDSPRLMRLMFDQWFAKFSTSPAAFFIGLGVLCLVYLHRITREEFTLFSTGCTLMGSELLIIFAFQIFFGYIYQQIGLIFTVFLAGLLPGAWIGNRLRHKPRAILATTDGVLIFLLAVMITTFKYGENLSPPGFLGFGFVVSVVCGCQFPAALRLRGGDNSAAVRVFSADLIGAAFGILATTVILIPYFGIIWAAAGIIGLKLISLSIIGMRHETDH